MNKKSAPRCATTGSGERRNPVISLEEFNAILKEPDREKREAMVDALTEEQAKYIVKSYANFLNRREDWAREMERSQKEKGGPK